MEIMTYLCRAEQRGRTPTVPSERKCQQPQHGIKDTVNINSMDREKV